MSTSNEALPFAPACERNRAPILGALMPHLQSRHDRARTVLEIGSGTGQHAAYFCEHFSKKDTQASLQALRWQCSDVSGNLKGIAQWRTASGAVNFLPPIELDLAKKNWPAREFDFIYTANTLHIVSWPLVLAFCQCVADCLRNNGKLFIYGPFNYNGQFTSASNEAFDASLRARDAKSGIRDCEAVCEALQRAALAKGVRMALCEDIAMPANNRLLVVSKEAGED